MKTTFSGPVVSKNGFEGDITATGMTIADAMFDTAANIGDDTKAINTTGKFKGKVVIDADGVIYIASGATPTSKWLASDGTPVTPTH